MKRKQKPNVELDGIPIRNAVIPTSAEVEAEKNATYRKVNKQQSEDIISNTEGYSDQPEPMNLMELSRLRLSKLSAPEIVAHLDAHVIAQQEAKVALSIAVRNRERRFRLQNLSKPENVSTIEEIGIRLAQKHGYTLRQELFTQIGRPTTYTPDLDPTLKIQKDTTTPPTTAAAAVTKKGKKQIKMHLLIY
eukprot:UN04313